MLRGEPTTINGDGCYLRDYVNVTDVAAANRKALEQPLVEPFSAFNVGTGRGIEVNELAMRLHRLCQDALNRRGITRVVPKPQHGPPRPGDLRSNVISAGKAAEQLGWRPRIEFDEGLRQTVEWFADRIA
jgi:UDP-glucose 4-epimerase